MKKKLFVLSMDTKVREGLVDIAPTLAAVLGQTLADADGKVLTALLK